MARRRFPKADVNAATYLRGALGQGALELMTELSPEALHQSVQLALLSTMSGIRPALLATRRVTVCGKRRRAKQ